MQNDPIGAILKFDPIGVILQNLTLDDVHRKITRHLVKKSMTYKVQFPRSDHNCSKSQNSCFVSNGVILHQIFFLNIFLESLWNYLFTDVKYDPIGATLGFDPIGVILQNLTPHNVRRKISRHLVKKSNQNIVRFSRNRGFKIWPVITGKPVIWFLTNPVEGT